MPAARRGLRGNESRHPITRENFCRKEPDRKERVEKKKQRGRRVASHSSPRARRVPPRARELGSLSSFSSLLARRAARAGGGVTGASRALSSTLRFSRERARAIREARRVDRPPRASSFETRDLMTPAPPPPPRRRRSTPDSPLAPRRAVRDVRVRQHGRRVRGQRVHDRDVRMPRARGRRRRENVRAGALRRHVCNFYRARVRHARLRAAAVEANTVDRAARDDELRPGRRVVRRAGAFESRRRPHDES